MSRRRTSCRYIDPQDFRDLRRQAGMTRREAAAALDVTPRTIQNWENGGARIPWMAYRMLRILRGYALPGKAWDGWTLHKDALFSPAGRRFDATEMQHMEGIFAQARLWRQMYAASGRVKTAQTVVAFPERRRTPTEKQKPLQAQPKRIGGNTR